MGYFKYMAQQPFSTDGDGRRLFYLGGPWSRPYIIPDAQTEALLMNRQLALMKYGFGSFIVGQSILFAFWSPAKYHPAVFLGYLAVVVVLFCLVGWLAFRRLVSSLQRLARRLPIRQFYQSMADRHSAGALVLGILGSLLFVWGGYWMTTRPASMKLVSESVIGWTCIVLFGLAAVGWGYALMLKLSRR